MLFVNDDDLTQFYPDLKKILQITSNNLNKVPGGITRIHCRIGIYQRSVWRITAKLPDPYPYKSPSIGFANKTYHPNVDKMSILPAYLKCSHNNFCYIPIPLTL
ncbi:unnamed protein product [Malus baccata var. baccata]